MRRSQLIFLFWLGLLLRLVAAAGLNLSGALFTGLSRDSAKYHAVGLRIAELLERGEPISQYSWVDDGWYLLIGYVYRYFLPEPFVIQALNATFGALAGVMTALMVWKAYGRAKVAFFAGWMIAVFPSFIYFNSLLLKDSFSLFLMATLGWAVVSLRCQFSPRYVAVIMACLVGFLGVREYFFVVGAVLTGIALLPLFGRSVVTIKSLVAVLVLFGGLSYLVGTGLFGVNFFSESHYFDMQYINETREEMDTGTGGIGAATWGENLVNDVRNAALGAYYFVFSVNPFELRSIRQYFALPEMIALLLALPPMWRGMTVTWFHYRKTAVPLIIFGVAVLAVYVSATTNAGALYRWRMQAFPFLFGILAAGLAMDASRGNPLRAVMNLVTRGIRPRRRAAVIADAGHHAA